MDDVAAVSKLFAAFDRSADGFISRDELVEHFSKLAAPDALLRQLKQESVEAATEALLKRVDADGDGRIRYVRSSTLDPSVPLLSVTHTRPPPLLARARAASKNSRTTSRFSPRTTSCACPT